MTAAALSPAARRLRPLRVEVRAAVVSRHGVPEPGGVESLRLARDAVRRRGWGELRPAARASWRSGRWVLAWPGGLPAFVRVWR